MSSKHVEDHYASRNPLVRYIFNKRLSEIVKLIPLKTNLRVLDAGCGDGHLLSLLSGHRDWELFGVDVDPYAVERAIERLSRGSVSVEDLTNLPFPNNYFDIVICTEVIEHINNYEKAINELARVLKPGGFFILTFPNELLCKIVRLLAFRNPVIENHVNSFSPREMLEIVPLSFRMLRNLPRDMPNCVSLIHMLVFEKEPEKPKLEKRSTKESLSSKSPTPDSSNIKLAIIIPTLNEKDICCCLKELVSSIKDYEYEVIIVDDSTDDTVQRIEDYKINSGNTRINVIKGKGEGLGSAIREGGFAANGDFIFYMDADMRIPLENIHKFISLINDEGYQIVVAERTHKISYRSPLRQVLALGLLVIQRVFAFNSSQFYDTQCGFRAFQRAAFKQIVDKQRVKGGMYSLENLYIAKKNSMRIAQVPVYSRNEIRKSKIKVFSCMLKDPVDIVRIKVNGLLGRYFLDDRQL